jgi:thymidylate synthase (FAD)
MFFVTVPCKTLTFGKIMIESDISVTYRNHMGDDTDVVDAARVSFAKEVEEFDLVSDTRLLNYLAKHDHWSPFAHTCISVRCKVPLWLARQLVKHQVGGNWNEESRRYIDSTPEFWFPNTLHLRPESVKQGSGGTHPQDAYWLDEMRIHTANGLDLYNACLHSQMAPEEARFVLPLNTMTNFIWTGSMLFFLRVIKQRMDGHAQLAAQEFAKLALDVCRPLYPHSFKAYGL